MRLKGKVGAITGSGRGIGRAPAELFAREGATVALLEMNKKTGTEIENCIRMSGGVPTGSR
jgi:NAD(P)-dependent dehydrogenase (short-subunit alcohol dehydrogenase family)